MTEAFDIESEKHVHGERFIKLFGGYFGDPQVARPLVDAIHRAIHAHTPRVLVDVGGGTGFVLSELLRVYPDTPCRLVDLDLSADQLGEERDQRITTLQASAEDVTRADLCAGDETLMLAMRSVIHYFGHANIVPFLKHLRSLLNPGEVMVHQTACYADAKEALFLDKLIKGMGAGKSPLTTDEVLGFLDLAGWRVLEFIPAPALVMDSDELAYRYHVTVDEIRALSEKVLSGFKTVPDAFRATRDGFTVRVDYHIFTSKAVNASQLPSCPQ